MYHQILKKVGLLTLLTLSLIPDAGAQFYQYRSYPYGPYPRHTMQYNPREIGNAAGIIIVAEINLACWNTSHSPSLDVSKLQGVVNNIQLPPNHRAHAAYILALCYEVGLGVRDNSKQAYEYYKFASEYGDSRGGEEIKRIKKYGYRTPDNSNRQIIISYFQRLRPGDYSGSNNNSRYESNPSPSVNSESDTKKTRQVVCTWCNGTGLVVKHVQFGVCSIANDCYDIVCKVCGERHCHHLSTHEKCPKCEGVGKITEVNNGYGWYHEW